MSTSYQRYTDYWNLCTKFSQELLLLSDPKWEAHFIQLKELT